MIQNQKFCYKCGHFVLLANSARQKVSFDVNFDGKLVVSEEQHEGHAATSRSWQRNRIAD